MTIAYDDLASRLAPHQGDWLRKSLTVSGVTVSEMADLIEVSRKTMTNYLAGKTTPSRLMLKEWAMQTGVPVSYLTRGVLDEPPTPGIANPETIHYKSESSRQVVSIFNVQRAA